MFINIDYNKRPKDAKLELAKPNKRVMSVISEKFKDTMDLKLGNINELNFSIPFEIDGEKNKHIDLIKEKMLIRVTLGSHKEWFVIDEIDEDGDDTDVFNAKAYSLGYELRRKRISGLSEESINATGTLAKILEGTVWKLGTIDPMFDGMSRSINIDESNALDAVIQCAETFGALIVWDTIGRKISFKNMNEDGRFRGLTINYGRLLRSIKRSRTTDEMVTRLYIEGSEGLTIHNVNPTGQGYIEDFSYFMYPFERDASTKATIKSSFYMSDALCHAILDHKANLEANSPQILDYLESKAEKELLLLTAETEMSQLELELDSILTLLDIAQGAEDDVAIEENKTKRDAKQAEINAKDLVITDLKVQINNIQSQIDALQSQISQDSNFTQELLDELSLFVIESKWTDDRYTNAQELYDDGLKKFDEIRQPKVVIDVTIDNLLNIIEEQYYWDKLVLGDFIKVKYPQMNIEYMAKIIEINYDLENREASIKIANTTDLLNETEKLVQLLYSNSSATSVIQNNKYKWDKINAVEKEVNAIISQEWDANKNKIIAGVNNTIEVGNRGIIIKNPDFPNEVVIMQSGIIALSKDGGETWKTAIKPDGIVAERLIGQIIAGQELIITNSSGSFTMDNNGVQIDATAFVVRSASNSNLVDLWNSSSNFVEEFVADNMITAYEKKMLKERWRNIEARYSSNVIKLNGFYDDQGNSIPDVLAYHQYYQNLFSYLFDELQTDGYALLDEANITKSTRIDRVIFENRFNNYDDQEIKVNEILILRAKELATIAQDIANEAKENIEEIENDIVYKIELHSTKGFTFKNGVIDTTISAKVYRGKDDITSTIPNSGFIWKKYNKDGVLDTAWTNAHVNVGNAIAITSADVAVKAIFSCDVDIQE